MGVQISFHISALIFLCKYLEVELLGHTVVLIF